jgi:rubrerythrin
MNTHSLTETNSARPALTKKRKWSPVQRLLTEKYLRELIATPEGRAHILSQIADAEDNGEARVFDDALEHVEDPQLKKMITRHREDEIRHGDLFRKAAQKTGVKLEPLPDSVKVLVHLNRELGGFFDRPIKDDQGIVTAYAVLLALEERAMEQFSMYQHVFGEIDPELAEIFAEVARDEERHLKYCHAITRIYAESEEARRKEIDRVRVLEAKAFQKTQQGNMAYINQHNLMPRLGPRLFWSAISAINRWFGPLPLTHYAIA